MVSIIRCFIYTLICSLNVFDASIEHSNKRKRDLEYSDERIFKYPSPAAFHFEFFSEPVTPRYTIEELVNVFQTNDFKTIDEIILEGSTEVDFMGNFDFWTIIIQSKKYSAVKHVLEVHFNDSSVFHRVIFTIAIENGATSLVTFMLQRSPFLNSKNTFIFVEKAAEHCRYRILAKLAKYSFDPNGHLGPVFHNCPLHYAVTSGNAALVRALLRFPNIQVNRFDFEGNSPLHLSTEVEISKLLLKKRADPFQKNINDQSAIDFAVINQRRDLLMLYLPFLKDRFRYFIAKCSIRDVLISKSYIKVSRERVLEDSFAGLNNSKKWFMSSLKLYEIQFKGESGIDHGGLAREWMSLIIERFFVPRLQEEEAIGLTEEVTFYAAPFEMDPSYKIYRVSLEFTGPLQVYKLIGSIIAKALLMNFPLKVKLAPSILKLLLGESLTFNDLLTDDPFMFRTLSVLLTPGYDFEIGSHYMPSDESILVTAETVLQFIDETAQKHMYLKYKDQIDQLGIGFRSIINPDVAKVYFSIEELQVILAGDDKVNLFDFQNIVVFKGLYWQRNTEIWRDAIKRLGDGEILQLVQFITGISGLPYGGIKNLEKLISIHDSYLQFTKSSTCFYELKLPVSITTSDQLIDSIRISLASTSEFIDGCC